MNTIARDIVLDWMQATGIRPSAVHTNLLVDVVHHALAALEQQGRAAGPAEPLCIGRATITRLAAEGHIQFDSGHALVAADDIFHSDPYETGRENQPVTKSEWQRAMEALLVSAEVLEKADAAVWDKHYGNGLSVEYARAVHLEITTALAMIRAARPETGREGK